MLFLLVYFVLITLHSDLIFHLFLEHFSSNSPYVHRFYCFIDSFFLFSFQSTLFYISFMFIDTLKTVFSVIDKNPRCNFQSQAAFSKIWLVVLRVIGKNKLLKSCSLLRIKLIFMSGRSLPCLSSCKCVLGGCNSSTIILKNIYLES